MNSHAHAKPDRDGDHREHDHRPDRRHDTLRTAAARRVVGGMVEFGLHRFTRDHYRKTERNFSQSVSSSIWPSGFDGAGCTALTGSDAGKLSIKPVSSFACISRSAASAATGLAACLSCGAGLNFSAIVLILHDRINVPYFPWFHISPWPSRNQRVSGASNIFG